MTGSRAWILALAAPLLHAQLDPREAALNATLARNIQRETHPLNSPRVQDLAKKLGQRLAVQFNNLAFQFTVIVEDGGGSTHEPIGLPSGDIFIPSALIAAADDESEFAGMLAHSMIHVSEHHNTGIDTSGTMPMIWVAPFGKSDVIVPVRVRDERRRLELEADRLTPAIVSAAGYDPPAFLRYLSRVQRDVGQYSAFPPIADRIANLEPAVAAIRTQTRNVPDESFQSIRDDRRLAEPPPPPTLRPPTLRRPQ